MKMIKIKAVSDNEYNRAETIHAIRPEDIDRMAEYYCEEVKEPELFSRIYSKKDDKGFTVYDYKSEKAVVVIKKTNTTIYMKNGNSFTAYNMTIADIEKLMNE